jgi:hypothetical protein
MGLSVLRTSASIMEKSGDIPIQDNGGLVRGHYAFIKKKSHADDIGNPKASHGDTEADFCQSDRGLDENPTSQQAVVKPFWEQEWFRAWLELAQASR